MNKNISLPNKWRAIPIERKIAISWIISILVVVSLSAILYLSKQELHKSSDVIVLNTELRSATQDILSSIQTLEISSKRFILTGSRKDSAKYFANLDSLQINLLRLESLIKVQPRFF
ncbi:MAG: CHASE3 domain-containing protein, partial [Melioribacteraceae bacterium]